jgi:hypothetical protein
MATCAHCKTQETQLYENGVPICLDCADGRIKTKSPATDQQVRATLLQNVFELTARNEQAMEEFETATGQIPSGLPHPDGVQRIKNASAKLATARQELMKAHRRLDEHIHRGSVPEALRQAK